MLRFLALHPLPPTQDDGAITDALRLLARVAHRRGVRPVETCYSVERAVGFTLLEAASREDAREAMEEAGFRNVDVVPVQRVHTELLDHPHRSRPMS